METIPLYCDACNKQFSGAAPAIQHFQGTSHKRKVENMKQKGRKPFCDVCNVPCDTQLILQKHQESPQHLANEEKRRQTQFTSAPSHTGSQAAAHSDHFAANNTSCVGRQYDFDGQRGVCYLCQIELTSKANAMEHLNGNQHRRKMKQRESSKPLSCNACKVTFSGPESAEAHFKSDKHRKKSVQQERTERGEDLPLLCNVCAMTFSGQESAAMHFNSKKHIRNVENSSIREQESNSDGTTPESQTSLPANPNYVSLSQVERQLTDLSLGSTLYSTGSNIQPKSVTQDLAHNMLTQDQNSTLGPVCPTSAGNFNTDFIAKPFPRDVTSLHAVRGPLETHHQSFSGFVAKPLSPDPPNNASRGPEHNMLGNTSRSLWPDSSGDASRRPGPDCFAELFPTQQTQTSVLDRSENRNEEFFPSNDIDPEDGLHQNLPGSPVMCSDSQNFNGANRDAVDRVAWSPSIERSAPESSLNDESRYVTANSQLFQYHQNDFTSNCPPEVSSMMKAKCVNLDRMYTQSSESSGAGMNPVADQGLEAGNVNTPGSHTPSTSSPAQHNRTSVTGTVPEAGAIDTPGSFTPSSSTTIQHHRPSVTSPGLEAGAVNTPSSHTPPPFSATQHGPPGQAVSPPQHEYTFDPATGFGYCHVCKIELTSEQHRTLHVEGSKHIRACQLLRHLSQQQTETGVHSVCMVCLVPFSGPEAEAQHLASDRHKKKVEDQQHSKILYCRVCDKKFSGQPSLDQHLASDRHRKLAGTLNSAEATGSSRDMNATLNENMPAFIANPGTTTAVLTPKRTVLPANHSPSAALPFNIDRTVWHRCDTCGCSLNSEEQLRIHLQSPGHRAKEEKMRRVSNISGADAGIWLPSNQSSGSLEQTAVKHVGNEQPNSAASTPMVSPGQYDGGLNPGLDRTSELEQMAAYYHAAPDTAVQARPVVELEITTDRPIPFIPKTAAVGGPTLGEEGEGGGSRRGRGTDLAWNTRNRPRGTASGEEGSIDRGGENKPSPMQSADSRQFPGSVSPVVTSEGQGRGHQPLTTQAPRDQPAQGASPYSASIYPYYCTTCKSPMNSRDAYENHMQGKRHREKVSTEPAPPRVHLPDRGHREGPAPKTDLRDYQMELYRKALQSDKLCFLPTGTGKTLVSIRLMSTLLEQQPTRQAVFLVDKVLLVLQQGRYIEEELGDRLYNRFSVDTQSCTQLVNRKLQIAMLCGGQQSTGRIPLWKHDIIIVTAAFCNNLLQRGILRWTDFCLVVFDEAHHCDKNHPFNKLLYTYHLKSSPRPRTLALTASPAGKSTVPATLQMLHELTGNLGNVAMAIVEDCEQTLHRYQSNSDIIIIPQADTDEARAKFILELQVYLVHCYMSLLRKTNISEYSEEELKRKVSALQNDRQIRERAPEIITNHLETIQVSLQMAKCNENNTASKFQCSLLVKHVEGVCMILNSLLEAGIPCAIEGLMDMERNSANSNLAFAERLGLPCSPIQTLLTIHQTSASGSNQGSQISLLIDQLVNTTFIDWRRPDHPMALVLVKERATARKLTGILNSCQHMQSHGLRVACVVGHGGGGGEGGMRVNQQKKTLEEIRQYQYQVIVATSVAEEGVDWPECELVISMYPPSTLTSLVQIRGRARKKQSKFVVLCNNEGERQKLEDILAREKVMDLASKMFVMRSRQPPQPR